MESNEIIGITTCDECHTRYKLRAKQASLEGKSIRCPKCHSIFTVSITKPSPVEAAAIEKESEEEKNRPRRRTRAEIRQEYIDNVRQGFRQLHARLMQISKAEKSSEEEVRRWCIDALKTALNYSDEEIDTEVRVLGKPVDIALKRDGHIFMVIECKNIRKTLGNSVRDQAATYASSLSAEWAVVTNGQLWKLYKVVPQPGKDPKLIEVFDVALLDDDGVSDADAENLYLLTSRAVFSGDLTKMCHTIACTSKRRVLTALESERVIKAIRLELVTTYKDEHGENVPLDDCQMREIVNDTFGLSDL